MHEKTIDRLKNVTMGVVCLIIVINPSMLRAEDKKVVEPMERWSVVVKVERALSPFKQVLFSVHQRDEHALVSLTRTHEAKEETSRSTRLVGVEVISRIQQAIAECPRGDESRADDREEFSYELPESGEYRSMTVTEHGRSQQVRGPELQSCSSIIEAFVMRWVDVSAYRHPFWEEGTFGQLRVTADVATHVSIDGVRLSGVTPIHNIRLLPGTYEVLWRVASGSEVRTADVKIVAEQLTTIRARFSE